MRRVTLGASTLLGLTIIACSGNNERDAGVNTTRDGGEIVERDAGPRDAGPPRDGGPTICDPVANTGCTTTGEGCLYLTSLMAPQCRIPGMVGNEQECSQQAQDCPGGYTCLFLNGAPSPICRKVCRLSDRTGCENLTGPAAAYACTIQIVDEDEFGWCGACANTCDPLAPNCMANQTCSLSGECGTTCQPGGSAPLNAACTNDACRSPGMCVALTGVNNDEPRCYEPCDLTNVNCTTAGYQCGDIGQPFGLCVPPM